MFFQLRTKLLSNLRHALTDVLKQQCFLKSKYGHLSHPRNNFASQSTNNTCCAPILLWQIWNLKEGFGPYQSRIKHQIGPVNSKIRYIFPVLQLRNQLLSAWLEPVLSHSEILFSTNIKIKIMKLKLVLLALDLSLSVYYPRKAVYNTMR